MVFIRLLDCGGDDRGYRRADVGSSISSGGDERLLRSHGAGGLVCVQRVLQSESCRILHVWQNVGVGVQGYDYCRVPQHLGRSCARF